tara:strand:+ start:2551 stop:3048 length:498 start_codon:yes stop_codon:yes gene_type:complete
MWAVIKVNTKCLSSLKKEFREKLGNNVAYYSPKLRLKKFYKRKTSIKEIPLLGDYLLCFHESFKKSTIIDTLQYCKGLKYFLTNFVDTQSDIKKFIKNCKNNEDEDGFIKPSFFQIQKNLKYEFTSGPFANFVFSIVSENKLSFDALIDNYKITVSKKENFFRPV